MNRIKSLVNNLISMSPAPVMLFARQFARLEDMTTRPAMFLVALACVSANLLCGDVTILYKSDFQPGASMPPDIMDQAFKPIMQASSPVSMRIKGSKAVAAAGNLTTITDLAKQEVTLIDPARKIFATIPASQFADKMAAAMPQPAATAAQAPVKMKTKTASKITGRTDTIQGIQAEEREITSSVEMERPEGAPQWSPVNYILRIWTAKPEEVLRVAALRELSGFSAVQNYFTNPADMLQKIPGRMPGTGESVVALAEEMRTNASFVLRTSMEIYMPSLAVMAEKMAQLKGQPITGGFDPNAPVMRMNQEVVEISSAPVDDSLFAIPKEFSPAPAEELIKGIIQSMIPAAR